eukprot:3104842-Amphidinium_carterae.1
MIRVREAYKFPIDFSVVSRWWGGSIRFCLGFVNIAAQFQKASKTLPVGRSLAGRGRKPPRKVPNHTHQN